MTFLDSLRRSRQSTASAYHLFLLNYQKESETVHAFFEGYEDPSFYNGFILNFLSHSTPLEVYICGSKSKVLEVYPKIMARLPSKQTALFFVDKDFSDLIGETHPSHQNLYITDYYSIENYLVSNAMFRRVWAEFFRFRKEVPRVDEFQSKFEKELKRFYQFMLPMMAWAVYLRRNGQTPTLNNLDLRKLFLFNDELVLTQKSTSKSDLDRLCNVITPAGCEAEIDLVVEELKKLEAKLYVRGKFELWFFVKFIAKLVELLKSKMASVGGSIKVSTELSETNAIQLLGPRLQPIPASLQQFLRNNLPSKS